MKTYPKSDEIPEAKHVDFKFDNSFARELEGFFVPCKAAKVPNPSILMFNKRLAKELSLDPATLQTPLGAKIFSGNLLPDGATPLAQAYAGHQFGHFSPQLGDGRALLLGEIIDMQGKRQDIQLKGSGRTPFSRGGDGKAALGPILREYLISEAMYALGVPTTRSLAAVTTGEDVVRETAIPGAILTRISASHLRVGTFEFFAARDQTDMVRRLADYAIARHYPAAQQSKNPYLEFFKSVASAQTTLVAHWMSIGFIHGVMNTDNTAISGQTIDYGPCAFMDTFSPKTVFSSIDTQGRYAYGNQPSILLWNLMRLAETLVKLVDVNEDRSIELLTDEAKNLAGAYDEIWLTNMRAKIGLKTNKNGDAALIQKLLDAMQEGEADFTLTFRKLSDAIRGESTAARQQFKNPELFDLWENDWRPRLEQEPIPNKDRAVEMDKVNPLYIPRNHRVEEALSKAVDHGNLSVFEDLLSVVSAPFEEVTGNERFAEPAPKTSVPYQTFCGT